MRISPSLFAALAGFLAISSSVPIIESVSVPTSLQQSPILTTYYDATCSTAPTEHIGVPLSQKNNCLPLDSPTGLVMNYLLPHCTVEIYPNSKCAAGEGWKLSDFGICYESSSVMAYYYIYCPGS